MLLFPFLILVIGSINLFPIEGRILPLETMQRELEDLIKAATNHHGTTKSKELQNSVVYSSEHLPQSGVALSPPSPIRQRPTEEEIESDYKLGSQAVTQSKEPAANQFKSGLSSVEATGSEKSLQAWLTSVITKTLVSKPIQPPEPVSTEKLNAWLSNVMDKAKNEKQTREESVRKACSLVFPTIPEELESLRKMLQSTVELTGKQTDRLEQANHRMDDLNAKLDTLSNRYKELSGLLDSKVKAFDEERHKLAQYKYALFTMMKRLQGQKTEGLKMEESEAAWQRFAQTLDSPTS